MICCWQCKLEFEPISIIFLYLSTKIELWLYEKLSPKVELRFCWINTQFRIGCVLRVFPIHSVKCHVGLKHQKTYLKKTKELKWIKQSIDVAPYFLYFVNRGLVRKIDSFDLIRLIFKHRCLILVWERYKKIVKGF